MRSGALELVDLFEHRAMLRACVDEIARARPHEHQDGNREPGDGVTEQRDSRRGAAVREVGAQLDAMRTAFRRRQCRGERFYGSLDEDAHGNELIRMTHRRPLALAALATSVITALSCGESSGPSLSLLHAAVLSGELERVDRAVATPQLQSLGTLALPLLNLGITGTSIDSTMLGRVTEWQPVSGTVEFVDRPGVPPGAVRVILYQNFRGEPAYPLVEIGAADLYPHNSHTGGGPDSISLRFVVTNTYGDTLGDFTVHSHAQSCQCATVEGWLSDRTTRVAFVVPYDIPLNGDGHFPGNFGTFAHVGTLPGPLNTTATAAISIKLNGDSVASASLLRPHAGRLIGESTIQLNGLPFASMHEGADSLPVIHGTPDHELTGAEHAAVRALVNLGADIDFYLEWPTFVVFFCGC